MIEDPTPKLYHYYATVIDVYDGDSVTVDWDFGRSIVVKGEKLRLYGINTPELRAPTYAEGVAARERLKELVLGKKVIMQTFKDKTEKYGRYLARIWVERDDGTKINVNDLLVSEGHAVEYYG